MDPLAPNARANGLRAAEGFSVTDVATLWHISNGTVYWLANKHSWRRYRLRGKVFYHSQDVLDALDQ